MWIRRSLRSKTGSSVDKNDCETESKILKDEAVLYMTATRREVWIVSW